MRKTQDNSLNMFTVSVSVLDSEPAIIAEIPALFASVSTLKSSVLNIRTIATEQVQDIKGIAQEKLMNKTNLAHSASLVAAGLKAFAHKNKMYDLESRVKCQEKSLVKLNDNMIIEKSNVILAQGLLHLADIAEFGIVAADTTTLSNNLTTYLQKYNNPTLAIEKRKFYTGKLTELFSQTSDILRNEIDPLMIIVSNTHPDFYKIYKNGRVIYDRHGKTHENKVAEGLGDISAIVTAGFDGSAVEGTTLELVKNEEVVTTTETDEIGEGYFENVPAGTYRVRATQDTYIPKLSEELIVLPGDDIELELTLEASLE